MEGKSRPAKPTAKGRKPKAEAENLPNEEGLEPLVEALLTSLCCELDDIETGESSLEKLADSRSRIFGAVMWLLQRTPNPNAIGLQIACDAEIVQGVCDMLEEAAREALTVCKQPISQKKPPVRHSKPTSRHKGSEAAQATSSPAQNAPKRTNRLPSILLLDKGTSIFLCLRLKLP